MNCHPGCPNDLILFAHRGGGQFHQARPIRPGLPKGHAVASPVRPGDALGGRLLQRSTRRLALTEFGQHMLEHARLLDGTEAATALAQHRQLVPQGTLRASFRPSSGAVAGGGGDRVRANTPTCGWSWTCRPGAVTWWVAERFDLAVRAATQLPTTPRWWRATS